MHQVMKGQGMLEEVVDLSPGFDGVSRRRLAEMTAAGQRFLDCRMELLRDGKTILDEVGGDRIEPFTHYPSGDVYDYHSHAQFYFHLHREAECGHFHTFLRPRGMPAGVAPADHFERRPPGDNDALSHLVAIALDRRGEPCHLFTTNRWVTAETWYSAADVCAMLPCFHIDHDRPSRLLNRWVTAVVDLFRPQIERLLAERDLFIDRHRHRLAGIPVLEDREIEMASRMAVNVDEQIALLRQAFVE